MKIICIIQARTTSSRLPEKVLLNLPFGSDITVLEQVIRRVKRSKLINSIIVATTINKEDDKIVEIVNKEKVSVFRGSEKDVLSRYYEAATLEKADIIVRITSDCPCVDAEIIDMQLKYHLDNEYDFTSNNLEKSFPHGLDIEIANYEALKEAHFNARESFEREHVMPYIYKSNSDKFKIGKFKDSENNYNIRITLDTKQDYTLLCLVYDYLYDLENSFKKENIIELFKKKSFLYEINSEIIQKKVCSNLEEELEEGIRILERQDLLKVKNFLLEKMKCESN